MVKKDDALKYYEYSRGDQFKVVLGVIDAERTVIAEIKMPEGTAESIKDMLISEAEDAIESYAKKYESN